MSHITGTVQVLSPAQTIGPGTTTFNPPAAPGGTKLLMLHFTNLDFKPGDQLQVQLGYAVDTFTAADGPAFWTRPVNVYAFPGGVQITYIKGGAANGSVNLDMFGRGERHDGVPASFHSGNSNCDPFYTGASYIEPVYDPFWFCSGAPHWDNAACVTSSADVRAKVMRSVGMIITKDAQAGVEGLSTCSVTLIDADQVITAGHCHTPEEALSSSITFDYATNCNGTRPGSYNPKFYKVKEVLFHHNDGIGDFSILRLTEPVVGVPIVQLRHDLPGVGEPVFGIHHPNGAVKKLSPRISDGFSSVKASGATAITVPSSFHVSGGSSGSGLFDMAGRICGVLSNGDPCCHFACSDLVYFPTKSILAAIVPAPPMPISRDVMVVFDRSGSMSQDDGTGRTKIEAAHDAAALFVQLVKASAGNRAGLVSFSTTPAIDQPRAAVTAALKTTLVGPPPFIAGKVGALTASGLTTIGGGLDSARAQLSPVGANPRAILLMTDGLQNEGLAPSDVDLSGITVHAIGFGSASSLDGAMLSDLATTHGGRYLRAGGGLTLEKFFSDAFGNIFENGLIHDPEVDLPANQSGAKTPFRVCGEDAITLVAGWSRSDASLLLEVTSPGGALITSATPSVVSSAGRTWTFLRIALPIAGERNGLWHVRVVRPGGGGEFPPPTPALRYFINVIPTGGPVMSRMPDPRRYYTGDIIRPLVIVRYSNGGWPEDMQVSMTITRPDTGVGNVLSASGLGSPVTVDADTIPARQATLKAIETSSGHPVVNYVETTVTLSDEPGVNGSFESGGLFGLPMPDLLTVEGNYTFHAKAEYTRDCTGMRETLWSIHVDVGIDPGKTTVSTTPLGDGPGGGRCVRMTFTPRDKYGNHLGPGRLEGFVVHSQPGSAPSSPVHDLGNGSYQVDVCSDPDSLEPPSIGITQPGRDTVVVRAPEFRLFVYSATFVCGVQKNDCGRCAPVAPGRYSTEINILNPHGALAPVAKRVIPLVLAGAATGREPNVKGPIATEIIRLPAHSATMDDCCRILDMALGAPPAGPVPITTGILEILSTVELAVTAVYTASDGAGGVPSIEVEQIRPHVIVV
jgi:von Willebrand factor type A domain/Trypsin-like peptidase domain